MHRSPLGRFFHNHGHLVVLVLALVSLIYATPRVRELVYARLGTVREQISSSLSMQLGRPFRYERLSPSIFRNVEIYGLEVAGPGGETLRIERARASYSLMAIIRGEPREIVDRLIIEDAFLEIDFTRDRAFIENVQRTILGRGLFPEALTISLRGVEVRLIQEELIVALTNIAGEVELEDPNIYADLQSRALFESRNGRQIRLESQVALQASTTRSFRSLDGEVALGRLFGSHLVLDPIAFAVTKSEANWSVTKQQDAQPFDLTLGVTPEETTVAFQVEQFVPEEILSPGPPLEEIAPWLQGRYTGSGELRLAAEEPPEYNVDLDASIPAGALPEPLEVSVLARGTPGLAQIEELIATTEGGGNADFSGVVDFERLVASGRGRLGRFSYAGSPTLTGSVELAAAGDRQQFSSEALTIDRTTIYQFSGLFNLSTLMADAESSEFELSFSLNPGRVGLIRSSGAVGTDGVLALDGEVQQVSLDELLEVAAVYDPRLRRYADSIPDDRYRVDTRLRLRRTEEGLFVRAPFVSLFDTEDFGTYVSLNLTYERGTLVLDDILAGTAGYEGSGSLFARVSSGGTVDFELDLDVEGIEYSLRGLYTPGDSFVFSGGHGVDGRVYRSRSGEILFSLRGGAIPLPLRSGTGELSFRVEGRFASPEEWRIRFRRLRLEGTQFLLTDAAGRLDLVGSADPSGITLSTIRYEDPVSNLTGKGSVKWQSLVPTAVAVNSRLESTQGDERYELSGSYEEGSLDVSVEAIRVPFPRLGAPGLRGGVDVTLRARGEAASPQVSFEFLSNEAGIATEELRFSGNGEYAEEQLQIRQVAAAYSTYDLTVDQAVLDRNAGALNTSFQLRNNALNREQTLQGAFAASYTLPDFSEAPLLEVLSADGRLNISGFRPLTEDDSGRRRLDIVYEEQKLTLSNWYSDGFSLTLNSETGRFSGSAAAPLTLKAEFEGRLREGNVAATITDIRLSIPELLSRLPTTSAPVDAGELVGAVRITGSIRDPMFFGTLRFRGVEMTVNPLGETIGPFDTSLILDEKTLRTTRTVVPVGSGEASARLELLLNRLSLEGYRITLDVQPEAAIPVNGTIGPVGADGFASGTLTVSGDTVGAAIEGRITAQSVRLAVSSVEERDEQQQDRRGDLSVDIEIVSGRGVQFVWPNTDFPVLRSTLATQQEVSIEASRRANTFSLRGDVEMQSGDVFYFDRNFYIREGEIVFDEDEESFDPRVSVRAELREATPEGPVRIYLVADNSPLSEFSPRFESSPPLSTAEIVGILGGNIFARTTEGNIDLSSALLSTSDILTQFGVIREFEDDVREALGLDLFSIRTQLFQNIVASAIEDQSAIPDEEQRINQEAFPSLGSYLNNSSIFMGKYLGNELFLETLVQLQADPAQNLPYRREDDIRSLGGVLIDPEIRLEWQTPFFLLEWNFAPNNPEELFIRDNTFTFSWGFSY
mgnify:CR=1 FL=1